METYIDLLPRDLIYELLDYFDLRTLIRHYSASDSYKLFHVLDKYSPKGYLVRWLSRITKLPKSVFNALKMDDTFYNFVLYIDRNNRYVNYDNPQNLYKLAIPYGYLSILKYIDEHYPNIITQKDTQDYKFKSWYDIALKNKYYDTLDYLNEKYGITHT